MRTGELRHEISIKIPVETQDSLGSSTTTWVDYIDCDTWAASTAYVVGDVIKPTTDNGYYYTCSTAGTSDSSEPTFGEVIDGTTNDNTAVWTCSGDGSINAAIYPIRGNELVESMKLELVTTHKIRIRYMSGIKSDMVIYFGSRTFDIVQIINPAERNIYLELLAKERI